MSSAIRGGPMPEILTESFCERCGTRYTFESAEPRGAKLKGIKVLSRGLKNFVMSDDTSMDEAMAAARSDTDREATAQQLDAFHKTFNFCMSCRQYTCGNCWNETEGQCLSCAPHLGHEILPAPFPNLDAQGGFAAAQNGTNGHDVAEVADELPSLQATAWPTSDLPTDAQPGDLVEPVEPIDPARLSALDALFAERAAPSADLDVADVAPADAPGPDAAAALAAAALAADAAPIADAPVADAPAADTQVPAPTEADERAAAAAAQTAALLQRFRPGQSLDEALEEFERDQAAAAAMAAGAAVGADAEPAIAATAAASPAEAEPAAVEPEIDATDVAAAVAAAAALEAADQPPIDLIPDESEIAAVADAQPSAEADIDADRLAAAAAIAAAAAAADARRDDIVEQPTWRIVAPDPTPLEPTAPPVPPLAPTERVAPAAPDTVAATAEPQWPTQPEWPASANAGGLPFLGRPATPSGGLEALWAESAREVSSGPVATAQRGGVQPCVSCGLSLSATARFCRRCGTRQG